VHVVSVLLRFVCVGAFLFVSSFRSQLVEACFGFCGFSATLFEVNLCRISILFFAVLLLFLSMTCLGSS
jgi:hypothetical protein